MPADAAPSATMGVWIPAFAGMTVWGDGGLGDPAYSGSGTAWVVVKVAEAPGVPVSGWPEPTLRR